MHIHQVTQAFKSNTSTPTQLIRQCIQRIQASRWTNCYITTTDESVLLDLARQSEERWRTGKQLGVLDGVPIAVKDNFCTQGQRTTAASKMLHNFIPPYDATVVERLKAQGAIIVGKTNMDEFGMGSHGSNSHFGSTSNPWTPVHHRALPRSAHLSPGGSSSGSAVAVAAGTCLGAIGSDTGGSVRLPAAFCGVVGLKPSYGAISRHGLVSYASSLDCPGVFSNSVEDAKLIFNAVAGFDPRDSTSLPNHTDDQAVQANNKPRRKIGLVAECHVAELSPSLVKQWETVARGLDAELVTVSVPEIKYALAAYYVIASAEASSNLARYDGVRYGFRQDDEDVTDLHREYINTRSQGFGEEVKRRLMTGSFVLSSGAVKDYYEKAVEVRQEIKTSFQRAFSDHELDALLIPSCAGPTHPLSNEPTNPVDKFLVDIMTVPASLAGLPAVSVPVGVETMQEGVPVPIGLQLVGQQRQEGHLLDLATDLERNVSFRGLIPEYVTADA